MELKEVFKALNLPEDLAEIKDVVAKHNEVFVALAEAHNDDRVVEKFTGKVYGPLNNNIKKAFGFTSEEIKDMKFEDILKKGIDGLNGKIKELSSNTGDEKITALTKERDTFKTQFEQYQNDLLKVVGEKTELETQFNEKIKSFKVSSIFKDAKAKVPFIDGVNEVSKIGFDTLIGTKYQVDVDDKDNIIVKTKDGKRVPNPTKSGTYLGLDEVLTMEADAAGILKKNPLPGNKPFNFNNGGNGSQQNNNGGDGKTFVPNAKAVAHAERLAEAAKR